MPIYEYKCQKCGRKVEILLLPHEGEPVICSFCGGSLIKLLSSGVGLVFKGSGFYITDYAKKEDKREEKREQDKGN